MAGQPPSDADGSDAESVAHQAADRVALALEDVGFDVGTTFPALSGRLDRHGSPVVELGSVSASVAWSLSAVLGQAARYGIAATTE